MSRALRAAALAVAAALTVRVVPARADDDLAKSKLEAKALLQSGNDFYDKKAYSQALDLFRAAYARFPSTKVLFNIGKALQALGRHREAAMTFDQYLAMPDADAGRRAEILGILKVLEPKIGKLVFKDLDAQSKVSIDSEPINTWGAPIRVDPGDHTVRVEKPGFIPVELTVSVSAGEEKNVDVKLSPEPPAATQAARVAVRTQAPPASTPAIDDTTGPVDHGGGGPSALDRVAITVRGVFDHTLTGAAVQPGLEVRLHPRLSLIAAATVGHTYGGYVGARVRILTGSLRPLISAGAPIFAFDGVRFGVRAAAGIEAPLTSRFSVSVEVGVEHYFVKAGDMREATVLAPTAAINAQL